MIPVETRITDTNFTEGREGNDPDKIVVHWWGSPALYREPAKHGSVVDYFHKVRPKGSSAHVVGSYQKRTTVVHDDDTAWHASNWTANLTSFGLELMPFDEETPPGHVRGTFIAGAEAMAVWLHTRPGLRRTVHNAVSNTATSCPGRWETVLDRMWDYALSLVPFVEPGGTIAANAPEYEGTVFMRNPVVGRVSSGYGPRDLAISPFHAGIDIAAAGGTPVYAAFAGVVTKAVSNRVPGQGASSGTVLAPGRSSNGLTVKGFVSGGELYGHIKPAVSVGQKLTEGQLIGYIESPPSGTATGSHLHFEEWANADNPGSHYDPMILFRKYGITPGVGGGVSSVNMAAVQNALIATIDPRTGKPFYIGVPDGVVGPIHLGAVKAWQQFRGLIADGDWGAKTQADWDNAWKPHVRDIWAKLDSLRYSVGANDGLFGPMMYAAVTGFQRDHGLAVDGVWGPVTEAAYQAAAKPTPPPVEPEPTPPPVEPEPTPPPVEPDLKAQIKAALPEVLAGLTATVTFKE